MGVYRGGYRHYSGEFLPISTRFRVIVAAEFGRLWRGTWNRRIMLLAVLPLVVTVAVMVGKGMVEAKVGNLPFELDLLGRLLQVEMLFTALLAAAAGSGILADDRAGNALVLYLSRPLTPARYLLGKGLALAGALSVTYLVPAWLFVISAAVASTRIGLGDSLRDLLLVTLAAGFNVVAVTAVMLLLSAVGRRARVVGLAWFGAFFFSQMVAKGAHAATGAEWTQYLSMPDLFQGSLEFLLAAGGAPATPFVVLLFGTAACICALCYVFLGRGSIHLGAP
jgi:ABC-type transport system involved in multi-copper enzyme maturation permease subunit